MIEQHYARERYLSNERTLTDGVRFYNDVLNPNISLVQYYNYVAWDYYRLMRDCINPIGPRGFRSPGPCSNIALSRSPFIREDWVVFDGHYSVPGYTGPNSRYDYRGVPFHMTPYEVVSSLPSFPPALLRDNRIAALDKFFTQVPTSVSVANFLYELKDIKGSIKNATDALSTIKKKHFRKLPAIANSTFLEYNFNYAPLVGDLIKFTNMVDYVTARLDFLRKSRGKPTPIHFINDNFWSENPNVGTIIGTKLDNPVILDIPNYLGQDQGNVSLKLLSYKANFHANATLLQELDGLDEAWGVVRATLASLGLNNPLKIVWNAIPFSFIMDWFFPIGKMMDFLALRPFTGRWDFYDVTNSVKESFYLEEKITFDPGNNPGNPVFTTLIKADRYVRSLGLNLNVEDYPTSAGLSQQQQQLFGSLLAGLTLFKSGHKS